jgi:hypothetical protein
VTGKEKTPEGANTMEVPQRNSNTNVIAWFVLWRFAQGFLSHDIVVDAFRCHPEWLR